MALGNIPLLAQGTVYFITLLLSLAGLVPMVWHVRDLKGHCLLYTRGTYDSSNGHLNPVWGSLCYCGFSLFVNSTGALLSFVQLVRMSLFLYRGIDSSFLSAFLDAVLSVGFAFISLISSVFVSDGFRVWCSTIEERYLGCEEASVIDLYLGDGIDTMGFYVMMGTAQFAHWASWFTWILQSVLCIRKLCIYHETENIIISMARERRLLNASQKAYTEIMQNAPRHSNVKESDTVPILE